MKKFDTAKITRQLKKINVESGKDVETGIQVLTNNLEIYNILLEKFENGDMKQIYLLYQMSATITKQLSMFNIFPDKKSNDDKEDSFKELVSKVKNIEKR